MNTASKFLVGSLMLLVACGEDAEDPPADTQTSSGPTSSGSSSSGPTAGETSGPGSTGATGESTGSGEPAPDTSDGDGTSETTDGATTDTTGSPSLTVELVAEVFSAPESAHFHAATEQWFVSNIAGDSGAPDGLGWVTRVDRDGDVLDGQWVADLDSPAGITSDAANLFVTDINRIHVLDVETAQEVDTFDVPMAAFLNDPVLAPDGTLYVSDSFAQAIWAVDADQVPSVVVQDEALDFPNGMLWQDDQLLIGSTGPFTDFAAEGPLHRLDVGLGTLQLVRGVTGKFDGLADGDAAVWMTDFRGSLLRLEGDAITASHDLTAYGLMSAADLGYDAEQSTLVVPDLLGDQIAFVQLPPG
ncbi:MAG: hypothetical protein AAF721_24995 [Myxococcota bacterium]